LHVARRKVKKFGEQDLTGRKEMSSRWEDRPARARSPVAGNRDRRQQAGRL